MFPDHVAVIHGSRRLTYAEFYARARRLASALAAHGIGPGDTVSVMLPNTPPMLEAHYGVPMTGAVLHALNTRLDAALIAFQLDHAESKVVICDREFAGVMRRGAGAGQGEAAGHRLRRHRVSRRTRSPLSATDYEAFLAEGDPGFAWRMPSDEWESLSLNYTSGTTGNPKGVVYSHRGAALMCYANVLAANLGKHPVYLWTLPMFHCNGWCFPWTIAAVIGTHVCLRWVRAKAMFDAIAEHKVTHLCGAPIVMSTLLNATPEEKRPLPNKVEFVTAAAPPPEAVLAAMAEAGFNVTHVYGLTEVYGPAVVNEWHAEWSALDGAQQAQLKSRQGVRYPALEGADRDGPADHDAGAGRRRDAGRGHVPRQHRHEGLPEEPGRRPRKPSPAAGSTRAISACCTPTATSSSRTAPRTSSSRAARTSPPSRWRTRSSSTRPWPPAPWSARPTRSGARRPCAFIELKPGVAAPSAEDIIAHCRAHLAAYKVPRHVVFGEVPKTSTGKIQKFVLRERAKGE